ncbi:unnamed protein product [Effrenium voratum]|nr:unnamed protein product [Effrenium voratum]
MDASASPVVPLPAVPAVRLVVRTLGGDVLAEPQVELSWSVWELKRALFSAGAPAIARQKLLLEERPLADSETLAAAGLSDGAQLLCLCVPTPDGKNMVQAVVRCRSMSEEEVARGCRRVLTLDPATNSARLHKDEEENSFSFYKVLEQHSELDELGQKLVQNVVEGYSSTVFAFGTTGSGKSSSLWGEKEEEEASPWRGAGSCWSRARRGSSRAGRAFAAPCWKSAPAPRTYWRRQKTARWYSSAPRKAPMDRRWSRRMSPLWK